LFDLIEGLKLMLIGMGVVFVFLVLLIVYMKLVPILSRKGKLSKKISETQGSNQKLKLNSLLSQFSNQDQSSKDPNDELSELKVAAIAAAIYSHTGKKPKQLVITSPAGTIEQINLWGAAGRQDLMIARDMTGQVGFQY
jgi:sodium pump decarboxylase gamma subunit